MMDETMISGKPRPELELTVFNSGWVPAHKKLVVAGGPGGEVRMPALFALIRHPEHGLILYDTGYHTRFYEATKKFPYSLMRRFTPAEIEESDNVERQLQRIGVAPEDVKTIILGHGHVDHVPGVECFPDAKLIVCRREWEAMQGSPLAVFTKAYLKSLYQGIANEIEFINFRERGQPLSPFHATIDLFGDGSLVLVFLPGHTPGQAGLIVTLADERKFFFIGDAAWVRQNYLDMKPPALPARVILASYADFKTTLQRVHDYHQQNPEVVIVPAHCPDAWSQLGDLGLAG